VSETTFANERDILYKFIFDLKKDVNEMKRMFVDIVQHPAGAAASGIKEMLGDTPVHAEIQVPYPLPAKPTMAQPAAPVYLQPHAPADQMVHDVSHHEEVEESLSIADMEKELIIRALKKHRSKRKDAALDLGISERTLYRKLKEYDIENL
jgi:DNA-binding NtrC family response regulator